MTFSLSLPDFPTSLAPAPQDLSSQCGKTSRPEHELIPVTTEEELQACFDVRIAVFVVEQGYSMEIEMDEDDATAKHFLLNVLQEVPGLDGKEKKKIAVGTVRFLPEKKKLGRLAVLEPYRSFGFGSILVQAVHDWVQKNYSSSYPADKVPASPSETPTHFSEESGKTETDKQTGLEPGVTDVVEDLQAQDGNESDQFMLKIHSQVHAIPFYEKNGYISVGPQFEEEGQPHLAMICMIKLD